MPACRAARCRGPVIRCSTTQNAAGGKPAAFSGLVDEGGTWKVHPTLARQAAECPNGHAECRAARPPTAGPESGRKEPTMTLLDIPTRTITVEHALNEARSRIQVTPEELD